MKKNFLLLSCTFILLIIFPGCIEADYHITINKDNTVDTEYKAGVDETLVMMGSIASEQDIIGEARKEVEKQGFEVDTYSDDDMTGIIAKKHYETLEEIPDLLVQEEDRGKDLPLKIEDKFFKTYYSLDTEFDYSDVKGELENNPLSEVLLKKIKLRFTLTLPVKTEDHNATEVLDEGRTLVWKLVPGENNKVHLQASRWNTVSIVILVGGIILLIAVIVLVIISLVSGGVFFASRKSSSDAGEDKDPFEVLDELTF